jgi:hypothetical protein
MDMDDLTPAGSGSLRDAVRPASRQTVATFTPTRTLHPGRNLEPARRRDHRAPPLAS